MLLVIDASKKEDEEDLELRHQVSSKKTIIVYNKEDLGVQEIKEDGVYISAKEETIKKLEKRILEVLEIEDESYHRPSFSNERQLGLLNKAMIELQKAKDDALFGLTLDLVAVAIQEAYQSILEILGEAKGNDFSEEIFSRFCVGK